MIASTLLLIKVVPDSSIGNIFTDSSIRFDNFTCRVEVKIDLKFVSVNMDQVSNFVEHLV